MLTNVGKQYIYCDMEKEFDQEIYAYIVENDKHPERGKITFNQEMDEIYRGSKRDGLYETWHRLGARCIYSSSNYRRGKLDGLSEKWDLSDNYSLMSRENYRRGKLNGLSEIWHRVGQLRSSINYESGRRNGECKVWHENGQLCEDSTYQNGQLVGTCKLWDEDGKLTTLWKIESANKGTAIGYFDNGVVGRQLDWKDDHFQEKSWYANGELFRVENLKGEVHRDFIDVFVYGDYQTLNSYNYQVLDGVSKLYHENGQLRREEYFKDGRRVDGPVESFDENGQLASRVVYKDDNLVSEVYYKNGKPLNGPLEVLDDYGNLAFRCTNCKNGKLDGYKTGYLFGEEQEPELYKNGKRVNIERKAEKKTTSRFQDKFKPSALASKVKELGIDVSKLLKKSSAQSKTIKNSNKLNKL